VRLRRELSAVSASGTSSQEVTAEIADLQRRIERQIANLEAENTTPALRRRITARIAELEEAVEDHRQRATQGPGRVAVCTKCPYMSGRWNLAPGLDQRGRVAPGHDVRSSDKYGRIATLPGPGCQGESSGRALECVT